MRLDLDNWRWAGVPFYLRSGKRLARRWTEIRRRASGARRSCSSSRPGVGEIEPNRLHDPHPAGRGDLPKIQGEGPRRGHPARGRAASPSTTRLRRGVRGHRLRAAPLRRAHRATPPSSTARTWSRPRGGSSTPILDVWSTLPARDLSELRAGFVGTAGGGRSPCDATDAAGSPGEGRRCAPCPRGSGWARTSRACAVGLTRSVEHRARARARRVAARTWPARRACSAAPARCQRGAAARELGVGDVRAAAVSVCASMVIESPSCTSAIVPPAYASGATWPTTMPQVPPEKRPSVIEADRLAEPLADQRAGRRQHLGHAGAALRARGSAAPSRRRP